MNVLPDEIATARLLLTPLQPGDAADIFRIYGDAGTWQHLPSGRFAEFSQAEQQIEKSQASFRECGLGMWAVRVGAEGATAALPAGTFIGSGGLQYLPAGAFNLGYRLAPTAWGRGFASEISREALCAGGEVAPQLAITARVLTSNPASAAVLEKVGLSLHWEGVRAGEGSAGSAPAAPLRRIYADRPLNEALHNWLVRNA